MAAASSKIVCCAVANLSFTVISFSATSMPIGNDESFLSSSIVGRSDPVRRPNDAVFSICLGESLPHLPNFFFRFVDNFVVALFLIIIENTVKLVYAASRNCGDDSLINRVLTC